MPDFYFFTDTDLLLPQTATEAYGPTTSSAGNDRFRTTSLHTANGAPRAYAICDGEILIQNVANPISAGPDIVNLILKPKDQPDFEIGYIKYFIYKGILKSSLIDSVNTSQIAPRGNNDLTLKAWENQDVINSLINNYYNNTPPSNINFNPPSSFLGINYSASGVGNNLVPNNQLLDQSFNLPNSEIQLLSISAGAHIGDFQANKFGFEIIVEKIDEDITFENARAFENIIEVPSLGGSPSEKEQFLHWFKKEKIHSYIDPTAFFGSFYGYSLKAYTLGVKQTYSTDDLYDNCLDKFENKSLIYLDIRNDFNYSLNALGNYGQDIKLALDDTPSTTFSLFNYYISGWPILTLNASDFGTMTNYSDRNLIRLQLPRGDNSMPLVYLNAIRTPATFPKTIDQSVGLQNKYGGLSIDKNDLFLPTVCYLSVPIHSTLSLPISTHNKLTITKQLLNETTLITTGTSLRSVFFLDHLFFPLTFKNPLASNYPDKTSWQVSNDFKYVDMFRFTGQEFMAKRGIATDKDGNITFFAFPHSKAISNNPIDFIPLPFKTQFAEDNTPFMSIAAKKLQLQYIKYNFERRGQSAYVETFIPFSDKKPKGNKYNPDDFIAISFTSQEYQLIEQVFNSSIPDFIPELPVSLYCGVPHV